ncbi:CHAD domain-containing protein [Roseateles sp.]|uniref:CYTH and CHAD domain-containing protein n=1 Tax=Roseateles sp. TaxID=1971397 RepID=UPI0039E958F4
MSGAHIEVELKFLVPAASRAALVAALTERGTARRVSLTDAYFDTPDQRLARAGLGWRMRREGRRWVQGLKASGDDVLTRFEHEVVRPDASPDPQAHAGTPPGQQLLAFLARAGSQGQGVVPHFQVQQRRLLRRVRTRGAIVDIALDEGRLTAGIEVRRLREVEFELVSGSPVAMLDLVERWRRRFGLILDPRNKAERGYALAAGLADPPLRKARPPRYDKDASALDAFVAVCDECLAHVGRSVTGIAEGDAGARAEHVHQARVGIRRLRSALSAFRGWVAEPPSELVDGLRSLFAELGRARDGDVLAGAFADELRQAGAPPLTLPAESGAPDLVALVRSDATQRMLLAWIAWRAGLEPVEPQATLKRLARRRLRRWHKALVESCRSFDDLDPTALHRLRKRVKRQRYALEFLGPLLPRKCAARHMQVLAAAQLALGEINDLVLVRDRYRARVSNDPAAWFAVGWLSARLVEARGRARDQLAVLLAIKPLPRCHGSRFGLIL